MSGVAQALFTDFATSPRDTVDGVEAAMLLGVTQSAGRSRVDEIRCPAHGSVKTIGDVRQHRYVHVLDGDWTIDIAGEPHACGAGTTLVAPRGAACGGSVAGLEAGRMLVLTFPG